MAVVGMPNFESLKFGKLCHPALVSNIDCNAQLIGVSPSWSNSE
jgi:hypothetical protein